MRAVRDVSFEIPAGAVFAIIGPNGAGKSTMLNLISGVYQPDSGALTFAGTDLVGPAGASPRAARHRAHVPEDPPVQAALRARQRRRGLPHPSRHSGLAISRSRAGVPARSCALPRRGDGAAGFRRARGAARYARGFALLRRAAHARVRARARDQAAPAADRRAGRRPQCLRGRQPARPHPDHARARA